MFLGLLIILLGVAIFLDRNNRKINKRNAELEVVLATRERDNEEVAKAIKREALLSAKEELAQDRERLNEEIRDFRQDVTRTENKLLQREDDLERKIQSYTDKENNLQKKLDEVLDKEAYLSELAEKKIAELERVSGLSSQEAREILLEQIKANLQQEELQLVREHELRIRETANEKAKEILSTTMQRCAIDQVVESTVSVVNLPSDDMKGRIIGREGRNIRMLETLTGVDLIIDDTPEAVVLSCFDPIKREIAKLTLEKLIVDGRIHPVRIEDMVEKAREEIEEKIKREGENAALDLGVVNLHGELIKTLGRLYFRTSYGQNVLKHSIEVGHIAGMIAAEIGANVKVAKRAGLLHDIGKAIDQTQEGTHIELGVELARKFGEREEIVNAIEAHHGDVVANSIEAELVKLADTISAGRPGSRRDTLEIYIKRLKKLEEIASSYNGIKQTFAVQAGREVRIIVEPEVFDDIASAKLARDIAKRIEEELDYPGQIRVTVVRETRTTEVAK